MRQVRGPPPQGSLNAVMRLVDVLGVSLDDLVGRKEDEDVARATVAHTERRLALYPAAV